MKRRRLHALLARLFADAAWAIRPDALEPIADLCVRMAGGERFSAEQAFGFLGIDPPAPLAEQSGQIAVLNISGTIHPRRDPLMSLFGGTSCEEVGKAFDAALHNASVSAIVLNIDSPGGQVPGVRDLAEKIYQARGTKPIVALANPEMCSALLWIGTAAEKVYAIPSATDVGSLGVFSMHRDMSRMWKEAGFDHTLFQSAPYKAEGNPFQPLSDEAKAERQSRVEALHTPFIGDVARNRGVSVAHAEQHFGQGRSLLAADALDAGLIDGLKTFEELIAELAAESPTLTRSTSTAQARRRAPAASSVTIAPTQGSSAMNPKVRLALIQTGLATISSTEEELTAALNLFFEARGEQVPESAEAIVAALQPKQRGVAFAASPPLLVPDSAVTASLPAGPAAESLGTREIISLVATAGATLPAQERLELQNELLAEESMTLASALDRISQRSTAGHEGPAGQTVTVTADARDKFATAARDAILTRTWGQDRPEQIYDFQSGENIAWQPAASARQYGLQSLASMAQQCMIVCGVAANTVLNLSKMQLARLVMGGPQAAHQLGLRELASSDGPAYNLSGMFSNILLDATNVLLRRSYDDTRMITFQEWMRQGESLTDFKPVHKVIAGELSDPKAIPEDGTFEETTLSDGKESYKLTVWGEVFSHSWQLIVNDQLGSFTEIPVKLGRAMRRKQNRLAYQTVKDNANLADGVALFADATHNNLTTGSLSDLAAYVTALNTMKKKMRTQKGLDADSGVLNIAPQHIVFPSALYGTITQLRASTSVHSANPGQANIWAGQLNPIEDAELDAAAGGSDTAFYLAASNADVDTVEYAYLQGLESPAIEQEMAFDRLAMRQRIYLAFAVKPLDFRGLQKHTGA